MKQCNKCFTSFTSQGYLTRHMKKCEYNLENIVYTCQICNITCNNFNDIKEHTLNCNRESSQNVGKNENDTNVESLKQIIKIYENILETNLNIKINHEFKENDMNIVLKKKINKVQIQNKPQNNEEDKKSSLKKQKPPISKNTKKIEKKRSRGYRHIKDINLKKELTTDEKKKHIDQLNEQLKTDVDKQDILNMTKDNCIQHINEHLTQIKDSRKYNKILTELKKYRLYLFKFFNIREYQKFIINHISEIQKLFKNRGSDEKKIKKLLKFKVLNPFESRLLCWDGFENTTIEEEKISFIKNCFEIKYLGHKQHKTFQISDICTILNSYYTNIFDIKYMLKILLTNYYKFNNIIYLPLKKSEQSDPYSFYYLETITEKGRNWRMDCRLEEIGIDLQSQLKNNIRNNFRKIYKNIYKDNDYRDNFESISQVFEYEGNILLNNLITICNTYKFIQIIQQIILENSTHIPTDKDRFNLYSDDMLQKRSFSNLTEQDYEQETINNFKNLFDTVNDLQIIDLYKKILKIA